VNGVSQGRKRRDPSSRLDRYRLRWRNVVYSPGALKVIAYDAAGRSAAEKVVRTAGEPHHLEIAADRTQLAAQSPDCTPDLAFVTVKIVDGRGNLCPDADLRLNFSTDGAVRFKAACNGDATSLEPFVKPTMKAFHGQLVVVVEPQGEGTGTLTVAAAGLPSVQVPLRVLRTGE